MSINTWRPEERPREKLLQKGSTALSDAELLAIVLRTGVKGCSAVDLARKVLQEFNSLNNLFAAPQTEFCKILGLGVAKYAQLQAVLELSTRALTENLQQKNILTNTTQTKKYVLSKLGHYQREVFACLFLDNQHRLIAYEELFYGTINYSNIHPREIVKRALHYNAQALVLAHNHPSGMASPSQADFSATQQLVKIMKVMDVVVLDHLLVAGNRVLSFVEAGLI
jgi:DNA repair protein RadC